MIEVVVLSMIRCWHFRDHVPLYKSTMRLGVSRNTVRRHIRQDSVVLVYSERHSPSKLDGHATRLAD